MPLVRTFSILLFAVSLAAFASDVPLLVRDLPGVTVHDSMSYGRIFWTNLGNTTWFVAATASQSIEIFKTDGTTAGTMQVTHGIGIPESRYRGPFLGLVGAALVYGGRDAGGEGIFALDTASGTTVLLGRFQLASLANGVVRDGALYFSARTSGEHELWRTNGTPEGTQKVDLRPGAQGAFDSARDTRLFSAGPWMFFYGVTEHGTGLHRTDGTPANTTLVQPLSTSAIFNVGDTVVLGDRIVFFLGSGQLWATDGTQGGTAQIGAPQSFRTIATVNGKLFFDGFRSLWKTDGTPAGTARTDILEGANATFFTGHAAGDRLFFIAQGLESGSFMAKLYVTEGTAASTRVVMPVNQQQGYIVEEGFAIGDRFYFRHDDGIHGMELWRTDGTVAAMFADINPGYRDGVDSASAFARADGTMLLAASTFDTGREPWITDGTPTGTRLLQNIAEEDLLSGSSPHLLRANSARLFFAARFAAGEAIGVSDGTSAGTAAAVLDVPWTINAAAAANGHYFFNASGLYASDGTAGSVTPLFEKPISPFALSNGVLFAAGPDLWFSDGTLAGTRKLHTFDTSSPSLRIFPSGSFAWIVKNARLWKTDGTDAGTVEVVPLPAPTSELYDSIRSGSWTYFLEASAFDHGYRLWRSDGSASGTAMVKDFGPPQNMAEFVGATDQLVYFRLNGKLYRSDGTDAGTIGLSVDSPCSTGAAILSNALVFASYASNGTWTLWRSDGLVTGTTALATMRPPNTSSAGCQKVVARGNAVYFSGWDAVHGWELWVSDGTAAGTKMLADIYTGSKGSMPADLTMAGDRLFFSADSPNIGRELWTVGPVSIRRRAVRP